MSDDKEIEVAQYFDCACHADEHQLVFKYISGKDFTEVYCSTFLSTYKGFFGRCWMALKYVFGFKEQYGHFDNWTLNEGNGDLDRLIGLLQRYKADIAAKNPLGKIDDSNPV